MYECKLHVQEVLSICVERVNYKNWNLDDLLALRAGYDQNGVFEYKHAYTFMYFLVTKHPTIFRKLLAAIKANTYQLAKWEEMTGLSLSAMNQQWHDALDGYCEEYHKPAAKRTKAPFTCPAKPDHQDSCQVIGHGFDRNHEELGESLVLNKPEPYGMYSPKEFLAQIHIQAQQDERRVHIGTALEDLLGPSSEHIALTNHMSVHHLDLLREY